MKKFLIKIAYRFLLKYSYDFLPYFYCGDVHTVQSIKSQHDFDNRKTVLTIKTETKWG